MIDYHVITGATTADYIKTTNRKTFHGREEGPVWLDEHLTGNGGGNSLNRARWEFDLNTEGIPTEMPQKVKNCMKERRI